MSVWGGNDPGEGADSSAGRPARSPRRRRRVVGGRQHRHEVKVTPEEEGQLLALALRYGVSIPKLLVESALAGGAANAATHSLVRDDVLAELFRLHRVLAGLATNVNQMAKATNATGEVQAEMSVTLEAVRRLAFRIDDAVDALSEGPR